MALSREAIRHQVLDDCFRNTRKKYYIQHLMNACREALEREFGNSDGAERTTIYKDITRMMNHYSAPIEKGKNGRDVFYYYSDRNFSIKNHSISEAEAKELREALKTLNRFKGLPQFEWIESISTRLEATFQLGEEVDHIIEFDQTKLATGSEFIAPLYHAILNKQVQEISYQPFDSLTPKLIVLHPYYLKQYNHRWYIMGRDAADHKISRLALDRTISINPLEDSFVPHKIDFKNYFKNRIGVSDIYGKPPEMVRLRVYKELWGWVRTKPLHHTQTIFRETNDFVEIKLHLIINYELETIILQHCEKIQVIEPEDLRDKISERIRKAEKKYENF